MPAVYCLLRAACSLLARLAPPILVIGLLAAPASAQPRTAALDELPQELRPGDYISVFRTDGEALAGRLLQVADRELAVRTIVPPSNGQPQRRLDVTIPFDTIQSLERPRDSSKNGASIGAGIGAGFVGSMFARAVAIDRNEIDEWWPIYLGYGALFTGAGALIGWAIDKAHSKPVVRFDRSANQTTRSASRQ